MMHQTTLRNDFRLAGIGLHTGRPAELRVRPAPPDSGIVFRRTDVAGFSLRANGRAVSDVDHATSITSRGNRIRTIEHLLSALYAMGVDNAFAEVSGEEIPILDGSAAPFVSQIHRAGVRGQVERRRYLRIRRRLEVSDRGKSIVVHPHDDFRITYTIEFRHPWIGRQTETFVVQPGSYQEELAPARTFAFLRDVEALRRAGLARGGSLQNALVLTEDGILNEGGLRFRDEFLRHKVLDAIGDLSLLGYPLLGHVVVQLGGHALHTAMVSKILATPDAYELVTMGEGERVPLRPVSARFRAFAAAAGY